MAQICFHSPIGDISVFSDGGKIISVDYGWGADNEESDSFVEAAKKQIIEYLSCKRKVIDLPIEISGTPFQEKVWRYMLTIPYGEVRTYGQAARDLNSSPRAVGGACGANHLPILIPCHRIVGSNGKMTGYSGGEGVETKKMLLRIEGHDV